MIEAFGREMILAGDLDPAYIVAHDGLKDDPAMLERWMVAYAWFIHMGTACYLAEQPDMHAAAIAELKTLPRGPERRHFRAANALRTLAYFQHVHPQEWFPYWFKDSNYDAITKRILEVPGFGTWTGYKLVDMGELLLGYRVDPPDPHTMVMYETPTAGARLVARDGETQGDVLIRLAKEFSDISVPPLGLRQADAREVETVLCRYKELQTGSYKPGKETRGTLKELLWRPNATARKMIERSSLWSFKLEGTTAQVSLPLYGDSLTVSEYIK